MDESKDFDEIFASTRKVGKDLGIDKNFPWDKININKDTLISVTGYFAVSLSALAFLLFEADSFHEYCDAFYMSLTSASSAVNLALLIWRTKEIHQLMFNIEKTYKKRCSNPASERIYKEMNDKINYMTWKFYFGLVILTSAAMCFTNAAMSFYQYFVLGLGADSFVLPVPMILPFNYRHPYTYLIALVLQAIPFILMMFGCVYNMSFLVGISYTIEAFTLDIRQELNSLTEINAVHEDYKTSQRLMGEFISVHAKVRQFVADLSEIFFFVFTGCLVWCLVTICSVLCMIQLELSAGTGNMFIWIRTGSFLFWSFGKAVVICENAQDITDTFDDFDYSIYQMDWWLFPLGIKRMLPLVLMNSQKPVVVQSFGNLICSRLTFKSIASGGISYFITIRQFT